MLAASPQEKAAGTARFAATGGRLDLSAYGRPGQVTLLVLNNSQSLALDVLLAEFIMPKPATGKTHQWHLRSLKPCLCVIDIYYNVCH